MGKNTLNIRIRDSAESDADVNFCMDIFGYTFFMSLAFAFIPQMIISFFAYTSRNAQLGELKLILPVLKLNIKIAS